MQAWQQALAGDDVVFCQTTLVVCAIFIAAWFVQSVIFWRLGNRFEQRSFCDYMLPFYGSICLCRAVGVSALWSIGLWFWPTTLFSLLYVGGAAAERMGKSFWTYGLLSAFLGAGFVLLADDGRQKTSFADNHPLFSGGQRVQVPFVLVHINGREQTQAISTQGLVIGSDPRWAQCVCSDSGVANMHVRVSADPEYPNTVVVEDLSTTQGTYYWDRREQQWHRLIWPMRFHLYQMVRLRIGTTAYIIEILPG